MNSTLVQRVAGKVVLEAESAILLLHPSKIDKNKLWHIPGGIRDNIEEPLLKTAVRELLEETGIDITNSSSKVLKVGEWKAQDKGEKVKILGVFYHIKLPKRPKVIFSSEHDDFAWVNLSNISKFRVGMDVVEVLELLYKNT